VDCATAGDDHNIINVHVEMGGSHSQLAHWYAFITITNIVTIKWNDGQEVSFAIVLSASQCHTNRSHSRS
jgi:hypothetical protein